MKRELTPFRSYSTKLRFPELDGVFGGVGAVAAGGDGHPFVGVQGK